MPGRQTSPARLVGVLVALVAALGVGVLIGYASFSGSGTVDAQSDEELACAALEEVPEDESFEDQMAADPTPSGTWFNRLAAVGAHGMATGEGAPFYDPGRALIEAASRLDPAQGEQALEDLRELCKD